MTTPQRRPRRLVLLGSTVVLAGVGLLLPPGSEAAMPPPGGDLAHQQRAVGQPRLLGKPGAWTKISRNTGNGFFEPGLLRTRDGRLHVVWPEVINGDYAFGYSTIARAGKLLKTDTVLSGWVGLQVTPKLVPNGSGIRLIFNGGQDQNQANPFALGARYTATSADGASWTLVNGSLSNHRVFNTSLAATTQADGTPVSSEGLNSDLFYHVGIDSAVPSNTPDAVITDPDAYLLENAGLARDAKTNAIYEGWYQKGNTRGTGYYVKQILPSSGPAKLVPRSGAQGLSSNEPGQGVALAARAGGGVYLAYCQASKSLQCARINLWKVGTSTVRTVPGSATGNAIHVSLSAAPRGRLVVGWYDRAAHQIRVVRTNTTATGFGVVRKLKPPVKVSDLVFFDGLFTESTSGRIDVVANVQRFSGGAPVAFFHTQVLAGLRLRAAPTSVTYGRKTKVTFTVLDAGQAVPAATITFLGHQVRTNSLGRASVTVPASTPKGALRATAKKAGYYRATVTVRVR